MKLIGRTTNFIKSHYFNWTLIGSKNKIEIWYNGQHHFVYNGGRMIDKTNLDKAKTYLT